MTCVRSSLMACVCSGMCVQHVTKHVLHDEHLVMYVCSAQVRLPRYRLNQPKMAQGDLSVFDAIRRHGVAGKPLENNEERVVARLAEVAKVVLEEAARELISSSQKMPVLFEYCGDGSSLKLKHAFQVSYAEHHKLVRSGYTGVELYCEGAFVRTFDRSGDPVVTCLLRDPRPMAGKGALHAFNGLIEFFSNFGSARS